MAINALIAQGIRPIGADVPEIASMLQQKRQQDYQNKLTTTQEARAQGTYDAGQRRITQAEIDAKRAAQLEWATNGIAAVRQNPSLIPDFIREGKAKELLPANAPDTATPQEMEAFALKLGIPPSQEKLTTLGNRGFERQADGSYKEVISAPVAQTPEMTPYQKARLDLDRQKLANSGTAAAVDNSGLSQEAVNDAVIDVLSNPANMRNHASFGQSGQAIRTVINNAKAKKLRELGLTEDQVVRQQAIAKGQVKSVSDLVGMQNAVNAYETVATGNGQRVLELIKKVNTSGVPAINSTIRLGKQATGNPDAAELMQVLQNYQTEVARIIANPRLVGQLTDTARKEIMDAVPANMTPAQAERIIKRLDFEFTLRNKGISDAIAQAQGQMVPGFPGGGAPASPTTAPTARPPLSSFQK